MKKKLCKKRKFFFLSPPKQQKERKREMEKITIDTLSNDVIENILIQMVEQSSHSLLFTIRSIIHFGKTCKRFRKSIDNIEVWKYVDLGVFLNWRLRDVDVFGTCRIVESFLCSPVTKHSRVYSIVSGSCVTWNMKLAIMISFDRLDTVSICDDIYPMRDGSFIEPDYFRIVPRWKTVARIGTTIGISMLFCALLNLEMVTCLVFNNNTSGIKQVVMDFIKYTKSLRTLREIDYSVKAKESYSRYRADIIPTMGKDKIAKLIFFPSELGNVEWYVNEGWKLTEIDVRRELYYYLSPDIYMNIQTVPYLRKLTISVNLDSVDIRKIVAPGLTDLRLSCDELFSIGNDFVVRFPLLHRLHLISDRISSSAISTIAEFKELRCLKIKPSERLRISRCSLEKLFDPSLPPFEELHLENIFSEDWTPMASSERLRGLRHLAIKKCNIPLDVGKSIASRVTQSLEYFKYVPGIEPIYSCVLFVAFLECQNLKKLSVMIRTRIAAKALGDAVADAGDILRKSLEELAISFDDKIHEKDSTEPKYKTFSCLAKIVKTVSSLKIKYPKKSKRLAAAISRAHALKIARLDTSLSVGGSHPIKKCVEVMSFVGNSYITFDGYQTIIP